MQVAEGDAALGEVVGGHLQRDVVSREDADVVLAHLARRVGDEHVPVVELHAEAGIRQHFVDDAVHLDQFFLGHETSLGCGRAAAQHMPTQCRTPSESMKGSRPTPAEASG